MESLEIEIDVNESYINRVEAGTAGGGHTRRLRHLEDSLQGDRHYSDCGPPEIHRQKLWVGFDKLDPRILPEMGVKVAFHEMGGAAPATARTMLVPKAAVEQQDGRDVVMVVQNDLVERRAVNISGSSGDDLILTAGVADGERVVVDGLKDLANGAKVKEKKP